eukprot:6647686-Prymnesium_polylepis.1
MKAERAPRIAPTRTQWVQSLKEPTASCHTHRPKSTVLCNNSMPTRPVNIRGSRRYCVVRKLRPFYQMISDYASCYVHNR